MWSRDKAKKEENLKIQIKRGEIVSERIQINRKFVKGGVVKRHNKKRSKLENPDKKGRKKVGPEYPGEGAMNIKIAGSISINSS